MPPSRWNSPNAKKVASSLPPLDYGDGPYTLRVEECLWRLWGIRGDVNDRVLLTEVESFSWDDASAVLTGSVTFRFPEWADKIGLREGHEIRCECSENGGHSYSPLWTMRVLAPNSDLVSRTRTANIVNDLNRLMQSDDNFVYVKSKKKPKGWRVDLIIRDICAQYGLDVAECPVMTTYVTNWHLTDQKPLDVIHSALIREKNATGRKYAVSLDWRERVHITAFRRPRQLYEIGPQLLAATGSAAHDPRFATELTVRADPTRNVTKDANGHRKVTHGKIAVGVKSPSGIALYGRIHRNVYSPDANSRTDAGKEGKLFLAAVAKPKRQFSVTLPGIPQIRRLDAFRVVLPTEGIKQIVYVSEAQHTVDGSSGYTTQATLDFDDPFVDNKSLTILNKLSDVAVARSRTSPATPTRTTKRSKTRAARTPANPKPPLGATPTSPTKPRTTTT